MFLGEWFVSLGSAADLERVKAAPSFIMKINGISLKETDLRAVRRAERERLKEKRLKYHQGFAGPVNVETPATCSCRCCGNPRKFEKGKDKLTKQEKINGLKIKDE